MRTIASVIVVSMLMVTAGREASAQMLDKRGVFGGLTLTYKVLLPPGYDATREYPTVLVFTGGPQQLRMAEGTITTDWKPAAAQRGYIVISPGTPDGTLFFEGADRVFPQFLDEIRRTYKVKGGKLHVAGHSNGGISAFHVAARHPEYFSTVTGYPGLLESGDLTRASALKPMCIFMHVGDMDDGWREAMQRQASDLKSKGYRINLAVEKNQVHRLKAGELNLPDRLLNEIESCR
jgi:poly(3-hydroxybutyrate) depolymerase